MSQTVITFTHTVDGVLTDADGAWLNDPTDTFGVQRKDTNAIIVPFGTVLDRISAGVYRYTFTDPAPNLTYRYFIKYSYLGVTAYQERETSIGPAALLTITGRYASYLGMRTKVGDTNLLKWASVNGSTDQQAIVDAITAAIVAADNYVDTALAGGPYQVPFTGAIPSLITESANLLAIVLLYEAQGFIDYNQETQQPQHRYAGHRDMAERNLARIKTARIRLLLPDGTEYFEQSFTFPAAGVDPVLVPAEFYLQGNQGVLFWPG